MYRLKCQPLPNWNDFYGQPVFLNSSIDYHAKIQLLFITTK